MSELSEMVPITNSHSSQVYCIVTGPEDFGWWSRRPRKFCIMVLRSRAKLLVDDMTSFQSTFFKQRDDTGQRGGMFWCAPQDFLSKKFKKMLRDCCLVVQGRAMNWIDVLPEGEQRRLAVYKDMHAKAIEERVAFILAADPDLAKQCTASELKQAIKDMCGDAIASFNHHYGSKGSSNNSPMVPCLLTNTKLYSFRARRPLFAEEHFLVQGMPTFTEELGGSYSCPFDINQFSCPTMRNFTGNMIHSMVAGALTAWALSNLVLVDEEAS